MGKIAKYEISLKCFLKNKDGEVLILKTPSWSSFDGMYDFPGGRIDEDEFEVDYVDILKREIKEETCIENVKINPKVVAIGKHKVCAFRRKNPNLGDNILLYLFFEGEILGNEKIDVSCEHDNFKWIKLEEIKLEDYFCSGYLEGARMYLNK